MRYSTRLYDLGNMAKIDFNGLVTLSRSYRAKIGIVRIVVTWRVE